MRIPWTTTIRGYVRIEVTGQHIARLLNELTAANLIIWDVQNIAVNKVQLYIIVRDYFQLRPILRRTNCRIHIIERHGLPFMLAKLERRKLFAAGFVVFLIGLYLLTSLVWSVQIKGYETIAKQDIMNEANKLGIYPMQWKFKLADTERLARELSKSIPGTAWVGIEVNGTKIVIQVVESDLPEEGPLLSPRHLISTSDAVVSKISVEQGQAVVRANQRVKKGDLLISGIIGNEETQHIVVAKGAVSGIVWHEYNIQVPLETVYKSLTGHSKIRRYFIIGNRALQVTGYGKITFKDYEIQSRQAQWRIGKYKIPLGWHKENVLELEQYSRTIESAEARNIGLKQARADLMTQLGEKTIILDEKVLHEQTDSGKVYMKVLFEVEQEISLEQPIIQGE